MSIFITATIFKPQISHIKNRRTPSVWKGKGSDVRQQQVPGSVSTFHTPCVTPPEAMLSWCSKSREQSSVLCRHRLISPKQNHLQFTHQSLVRDFLKFKQTDWIQLFCEQSQAAKSIFTWCNRPFLFPTS